MSTDGHVRIAPGCGLDCSLHDYDCYSRYLRKSLIYKDFLLHAHLPRRLVFSRLTAGASAGAIAPRA